MFAFLVDFLVASLFGDARSFDDDSLDDEMRSRRAGAVLADVFRCVCFACCFCCSFHYFGVGGFVVRLTACCILFMHDNDDAKDAWDEIFHLLVGFELFFTYSPSVEG